MYKVLGLIVALIAGFTSTAVYVANHADIKVDEAEQRLGANQKITELTAGTTLQGTDNLVYVDNSGTPTTKKITIANATSSLQTYYDGRYQTLLVNSAGLLAALSDETGSGLAVFGTSPTIGTPILNTPAINTPTINVSGTEAAGDLLYLSTSGGVLSRLGVGSNGDVLSLVGGLPSWGALTGTTFGSTTFNATTTIAADNVLNRALVLNGLAYKFPATRGIVNASLREDGSGNLSWATTTDTQFIPCTSSTGAYTGVNNNISNIGMAAAGTTNCYVSFAIRTGSAISSIQLVHSPATGASGNVIMTFSFYGQPGGSADVTDGGTSQTIAGGATTDVGYFTSITATEYDGLTIGTPWHMKITRLGDDGGDTFANGINVNGILITSTK